MLPTAAAALTSGRNPERTGNAGWIGSPGADTFQCADGFVAVAANTFAQLGAMARVLQLDDVAEEAAQMGGENPNRFARRADIPRLHERLADACRNYSAEALEVRFNASAVPAARVRTLVDVVRETSDGTFSGLDVHRVRGAHGAAFVPGLRLTTDHVGGDATYPAHGQHTRAVLEEIGLEAGEIEELLAAGLAYAAPDQPATAVSI
jgi:crotonobetainyl-CoA:carnitine CoA-transferase CaiB-like acyl-CoA transferase